MSEEQLKIESVFLLETNLNSEGNLQAEMQRIDSKELSRRIGLWIKKPQNVRIEVETTKTK